MTANQTPESPIRRVLVAGASGFVGRRLCPALVEAGYDVVSMTRHPETYDGCGRAVRGDVHEPASLRPALEGCDAAYYLVHSLDSPDFERLDAAAARAFGTAAAQAGVQRIIYLGGLGNDTDALSPHLRSRREVEGLLGEAGVPVTTLRAGIVIGHEGLSWEMTRQLVERLPMMITPKWVSTKTQPIAVADVVRYLVGVLDVPETVGRAFEVGGDEVLRYSDMMKRVARVQGRSIVILPVPLLSPNLSSHWLSLITDVDTAAGRSLVDSMVNEVVVHDDELHRLIPFDRISFDDAIAAAFEERTHQLTSSRGLVGLARRKLPMSLAYKVPIRHEESDAVRRRRRRVVAATSVVGAGLLGVGLSAEPGSKAFYGTTFAVAGIYTAGGFASGPLHLGWIQLQDRTMRRPIITPVATGVATFGVFYVGAHIVKQVPPLGRAVASILQFAEDGDAGLVLATTWANGVAEEIFFRGAVYAALLDYHPVLSSTGVYMLATIPTRNPMLVFAAGLVGTLWAAQRRATNGLQAPVISHMTWSLLMLKFLPPVFADVLPTNPGGTATTRRAKRRSAKPSLRRLRARSAR